MSLLKLQVPCRETLCRQLFNERETEAQIPDMPQREMPANIKRKDG